MNKYRAPAPGIFHGDYPEKPTQQGSLLSRLKTTLFTPLLRFESISSQQYKTFVQRVEANETKISNLEEGSLNTHITSIRALLSMHGLTESLLAEVFALISHVSQEALGIKPYHTQLIAARIMLDGKLAEMATGEGKTLAASICASAAAMAGIPVHLITSNDYLVTRDAEISLPLYQNLGLTVGTITQPLNDTERKAAYACDITYTTAKELVFDYLRDRFSRTHANTSLHYRVANISDQPANRLLRGLCMAIIDEADSIMIDEATVPLILSQGSHSSEEHDYYSTAFSLAATLKEKKDFLLNQQSKLVELMSPGKQLIQKASKTLKGPWKNTLHREEIICQALAAQHLYHQNQQYIVKDEAVYIIDEITGRIAVGRIWSRGLHQLIEIKEGCKPSNALTTVAQITYQRFFPRYLKLGGMSGTLKESRKELFAIYGLKIKQVPLKKPNQRTILPSIIYPNKPSLWQAVINKIKDHHQTGRPILIGTDSVDDSESLSRALNQAGLMHTVLNARQDQQEADIIAKAGQKNQITISTNMAGRGTDIKIEKEIIALGGIHLISCQHNVSRRIDRQLLGRCGRQGQPGSTETLISMNKPLIQRVFPKWVMNLANDNGLSQPTWLVELIIRLPQWIEESNQYSKRHEMMKRDTAFEKETLLPD